jgi:hypothetical protein
MEIRTSFDLPRFMLASFPRVDFGGDLFGQWPVGIRFEIGLDRVSRATQIYQFVFSRSQDCVLVSQEWPSNDRLPERFTPLFSTPGIFSGALPPQFQTMDVFPFDETPNRLTWARLPLNFIDANRMFEAIANGDHGRTPSIAGRAYIIDDRAKLLMHMYDDRGLDVIATSHATLLPMYEQFGDWILDNQRHRITFRFKNFLAESRSSGANATTELT